MSTFAPPPPLPPQLNGQMPPPQAPAPEPEAPLAPGVTPAQLAKAINADHRWLEPFRVKRRYAVREACGAHFGKGDAVRRPVNLLAQAQATLVPNLVIENPKRRVRTARAELRGEAELLELALTQLGKDLNLVQTMREVVVDAIYSPLGIVRVGMAQGSEAVKYDDWQEPRAEPFVARIDFEDYVYDTTARCRREMRYEGHRYRIPKKTAQESGIFGRDPQEWAELGLPPIEGVYTRAEAAAAIDTAATIQNDPKGEDYGTRNSDRWDLNDEVELWDVALYERGRTWLVTVLGMPEGNEPATGGKWLMCEPMNAPRQRPYLTLAYMDVPNSPLGLPLAAQWMDLHDAAVVISGKFVEREKNRKTVFGYRPDSQDDALTVRDAPDGQFVKMTDPSGVETFEFGAAEKGTQEALQWVNNEWANASGNLPLAGGQDSGATSGTATAAQYLQANSSIRIRDLQDRVRAFMVEIDTFLGQYLTTDPTINLPLPYRMPGGQQITVNYTAAERQAGPNDVNFEIEQFADVGMDPNVRIARVRDFLGLTLEAVPGMQAGLIQPSGMVSIGRQEFGIENLDELIPDQKNALAVAQTYAGVPPPGGPKPQAGPPMPPPGAPSGAGPGGGPAMQTPIAAGRSAMSVPSGSMAG